jgi:hypothetical protein
MLQTTARWIKIDLRVWLADLHSRVNRAARARCKTLGLLP